MIQEFFWTWIPWIFNKATVAVDTTKTILRVLYNELTVKKEFVFLKGVSIPISTEAFGPMTDLDTTHVKWRCPANPSIFIEPGFAFEEERHLSYLGFVVKVSSTKEIDISDWVNELKWKGAFKTNGEPTVREIFLLWCCLTGESYFHCLDEIQVEYINDMGDSIKSPL